MLLATHTKCKLSGKKKKWKSIDTLVGPTVHQSDSTPKPKPNPIEGWRLVCKKLLQALSLAASLKGNANYALLWNGPQASRSQPMLGSLCGFMC